MERWFQNRQPYGLRRYSCIEIGFNIYLKMSESDGFIYGGNGSNCLTWMDKMGSSQKSGNKGKPATPRNGAPIEMTSILKKCLSFVVKLADHHHYKHKSVSLNNKKWHFKNWLELI